MERFEIEYAAGDVADLRERLRRTRWPEAEPVGDWSQGIPLAYVQELAAYWAEEFDFGAAQARLNALPHLRTEIDGLPIHAAHVRSPHEDALPLLLTHGWPGSVVEFLGVVEALTRPEDPADAFHLVLPSLPGYGWSGKPAETGWSVERTARAWAELMGRLGYGRYGAQGGDWGAMVTTALAGVAPDRLAGIHLNMPTVDYRKLPMDGLSEGEKAGLVKLTEHRRNGTGYSKEQSTRPQTVGYGLTDSPAGQLAWITEKLHAWSNPASSFTREQILDNVSVYWFTRSATSSARLYWESFRGADLSDVTVPTGISAFPHEIFPISRRWAETRFTDLRSFTEPAVGGHFAAFEQPELFAAEVRDFFRLVR